MHKWKYKIVAVKIPTFAKEENKLSAVEDKLNRLGMDGWELVHPFLPIPGYSSTTHLYMKRAY
ncbi:MAG: hypothetical protein COB56_08640 [Robiginitomaculum sp.]|nr:MAG: hypothetical protein COB56_08640 [Robiginitomaculum sp.]